MNQISECSELLNTFLIPKLDQGFRRPLNENDFNKFKQLCDEEADKLHELLKSLILFDGDELVADKDFIVLLLLFCGEHYKLSLWTDEKTLRCYRVIYGKLFSSHMSPNELFTKDNSKILKLYLKYLQPYLLKSTWKEHPTALSAYGWMLYSISAPHIGDNLELILPTALIAADDFLEEYKHEGVLFLKHIIQNITRGELSKCSYDEVIYKALDTSFYVKEASLIADLVSCVLALLAKMYQQVPFQKLSHYNNFMEKILYLMKLEGSATLRQAYMKSFPEVIYQMGLPSASYLKNIIEIINDYSLYSSTILNVFEVIEAVLVSCGPCVNLHLENITFILFKILLTSKKYVPVSSDEIEDLCKQKFIKISILKPNIFSIMKNDEKFSLFDPKVQSVISEVIDAT